MLARSIDLVVTRKRQDMSVFWNPTTRWIGATALFTATLATGAAAAPATSDEIESPPAVNPGSSRADPSAESSGLKVPPTVPQSRTVELLLQLQDQPGAVAPTATVGRQESSRPAQPPLGARVPTGSDTQEAPVNPLGSLKALMSSDSRSSSSEESGRTAERPDRPTTSAEPQGRRHADERGAPSQPRESLLSNPLVRWVRENRTLTIAVSLIALAAVWLTANLSVRRGRR